MKEGLSGRTRRGSPPLPRQRKALRVVQITLLAVAAGLMALAADAVRFLDQAPPAGAITSTSASLGDVVGFVTGAVLALSMAAWMGLRPVRGPRPPTLD